MPNIEFTHGNLLTAKAEALVNTVNCVGVMGRGIALQFKKAFPENFREYQTACKREQVRPGQMFITERVGLGHPRYIINFPTKRHWKGKSRMEDIEAGLVALAADIQRLGITSIAIPPLGAGLGGLDWAQVRKRIEATLGSLQGVHITVYEPGEPPPILTNVTEAPRMTAGRAALVGLMDRYLAGLLDPMVSLLEVQKLMYFLQEAGQPLRLEYVQGPYGPYTPTLGKVLRRLEGHLVQGYADGGDDPHKLLSLVAGAREEAGAFMVQHPETLARFEQVIQLIDGFETPYGMELLSTVHFAVNHLGARAPVETVAMVHDWNDRKKQFTSNQIALARNVLANQGWLRD